MADQRGGLVLDALGHPLDVVDEVGIGVEAEVEMIGQGDGRDPEAVTEADLGDRMERLDRRAEDADRVPRPGHVGDVDGELARAALDPLDERREPRRVPAQRGRDVVELLGVVLLLADRRLAIDGPEALDRIVDPEWQPHREERVAVSGIVTLVMEADRDADADVAERAVMALEPAPQRARHYREDGIVEGRAGELAGGVVEAAERRLGDRDPALGPDPAVERRAVQRPRELALDERGEVGAAALVIGMLTRRRAE